MIPDPTVTDRWLDAVPDFQRFLTVDELYAQARRVAEQHKQVARSREVGRSTDGEPIPMVSLGDGPVPLLFYACPHPNEPIGAMLVSHLLDWLPTQPELLRGFTWHLLPCVDPDGTRLNEGWFAGPFTIRNYARGFYRPPGVEQVEWTFPVEHKRFRFGAPTAETRALMSALETVRPAFVYSLHNAGFGGVYYYLNRTVPQVYPEFYRVPESLGLTLARGEAEIPWAETFAPAIYRSTTVADAYDYFETMTDLDPAAMIGSGGSSGDFLNRLYLDSPQGPPLTLVTELPYFQAPQLTDETLTRQTRREVLLAGLDRRERLTRRVEAVRQRVSDQMTLDSRPYRAFSLFHRHALGDEGTRQALLNDASTLERATVAQRADALYVPLFYQLLILSMFARGLNLQRAEREDPELRAAERETQALIDEGFTEIETHLPSGPVPIRKAVQTQLGALAALLPLLADPSRQARP